MQIKNLKPLDKDFTKKYSKLANYYKKELTRINKSMANAAGFDYFITYLRYLRDYFILTDLDLTVDKNNKLATISTAIVAYETYANSFEKYYDTSTGVPVIRDTTKTKEEIAELYNKEKTDSWVLFWRLVITNLEGWLTNNDTSF